MLNSQSAGRSPSAENLETEIKFHVPDLSAVRARLLALGARLTGERIYQRNVRFDTAEDTLLQRGALLRLRQDRDVRLTFKGMPKVNRRSQVRVLEELEVKVDSFEMATMIVNRLGFVAKQVYEKYRETFALGDVEVVLDELPFGDFVEIEGDEAAIKDAAMEMGLDWGKRITMNYLSLMASLKEHHHLSFNDVTFANFEGLSVSIADVLT